MRLPDLKRSVRIELRIGVFESEDKLVCYGAKSLPYGGWYAMPRTYVDGGLIIGDSGSFLDSQRLKGIHLAMKRSEERRVGKECKSRWSVGPQKTNKRKASETDI